MANHESQSKVTDFFAILKYIDFGTRGIFRFKFFAPIFLLVHSLFYLVTFIVIFKTVYLLETNNSKSALFRKSLCYVLDCNVDDLLPGESDITFSGLRRTCALSYDSHKNMFNWLSQAG